MDALVGVQRLDEAGKILRPRLLWQRVLERGKAAFLSHAALGGNINVACRILADDDDGQTRAEAGVHLQRCGRRLHAVNHGRRNLFSVDVPG